MKNEKFKKQTIKGFGTIRWTKYAPARERGDCRVTLERAIRRAGGLDVKATNRIGFDDQPIVGEIVC
jgi:hypothetical protein